MDRPVALITGASQGLGRAIAETLAARGWRLVIDARRHDRLEPTAASLASTTEVVAIAGDVTDVGHRADLIAAIEGLGRLDLVVNNASTLGTSPLPSLATIDLDVLRDVFETNVVAPVALTQSLLPELRDRGGTVVNITSDAGVEAYAGWGGYGSSKAALEHLSAVLAAEEPKVRVLWVDPGDMRTELYATAVPDDPDFADRAAPEAVAPALLRLLDEGAVSGRYSAPALLEGLRQEGAR